jgi:hypothetical protein
MTVNDLVTSSLKLIGAVSATNPPSADETADVLARLQDMLDSWMAERLTIYFVQRSLYPLVAGQQTYTIGSGGTFNQARPVWIQNAGIISNTNPTQPLELPMTILSPDDFASVSIKSVASSLSWYLYYDYQFDANGRGTIWVWPIPNIGTLQIALYVPTPLSNVSALVDPISFPPGYAEAIRFNLAARLAPEFGKPLDPVVAQLAVESLARIQRANKRLAKLRVDPALTAASAARIFNYLTGDSGGGTGPM